MRKLILPLLIMFMVALTPQLCAKQVKCVVKVVDTGGRPIKDAEVSVWGHNYDIDSSGSVIEQLFPVSKTDAEGYVHVNFETNMTENNIFVFAQKAGFAIGWNGVFCKARITNIRIVLDRTNSTAGIVMDEKNQPIVGAKVTAYPIDDVMIEGAQSNLRWPDSILTTETDHEGRFSFDCLAEWMEVHFVAEYLGRAYTDTAWNLEGQRLPYYKAGQKDIHITMHPAGRIEGKILADRGYSVRGIKLTARGERIGSFNGFTAVSDIEGRFVFEDLPPNTYLVTTLTKKDNITQQLTAGAFADVETGQTVENVKVRLRDPIKLDVLVKDIKTNQPVQHASVYVTQRRISKRLPHLSYTVSTNNRGIARLLVLPGKCHLYADHDDYDWVRQEYLVRSTDSNLEIGLNPKLITYGKVIYENGYPAPEVEVATSPFETERKLTDASGNFRIKFSPKNAQKGFVIARDIRNNMAGIVDITENRGPVTVTLTKAAILKGRVVDPDERSVSMAKVKIAYLIPHYITSIGNHLYTDEDGQFEIRAIPYAQEDFRYLISVSACGYGLIEYERIDVTKEMGKFVELPPLILKPCNIAVSGVAVYEDGSPAAHKSVHLDDIQNMQGQPRLHSATDKEGKFCFEGVCEGWLRIQCGYASESSKGFIYAKGGDTVTVIMNNNYKSSQLYSEKESYIGDRLPMYEVLMNGIDPEMLNNKKLLICCWYFGNKDSKNIIKELTGITDELDKSNISVILFNVRPYSKKYASVNIDADKKWLQENNIPFMEANMPDREQILEMRRASGMRFIPCMILTDENKIITNEGFDVDWLKENVL